MGFLWSVARHGLWRGTGTSLCFFLYAQRQGGLFKGKLILLQYKVLELIMQLALDVSGT